MGRPTQPGREAGKAVRPPAPKARKSERGWGPASY